MIRLKTKGEILDGVLKLCLCLTMMTVIGEAQTRKTASTSVKASLADFIRFTFIYKHDNTCVCQQAAEFSYIRRQADVTKMFC